MRMPALPPRLKALLRPRAARLALGVSALSTLGLCLSPLTALHGVESALVLGLVLPPFVAADAARRALAARDASIATSTLVREALALGALTLALPFGTALIAAAFVRWCAPLEGLAFSLLGPTVGVALAALFGVFVGALVRGARAATTLAALGPLGATALGLSRFYTTPAIFAYGHFVGFFPGTLYDPDVAITSEYLSFRALSAAWLGALALALGAARDPDTGRLSLTLARRSAARTLVALGLAALGVGGEVLGPELGHRATSASIAETLGGRLRGERCDVIVPRELARERAERLRDDCDFRVRRAEAVLGVTHPARITAFFFRDEAEKRRLMGASGTYIAKPWRDEVYLQLSSFPHPVLFHEIVHVVAAATGVGPFRISGRLGGLWPSPGILEGTAVAVAWDASEGLTPHEWAAALARIGHAPSIARTEGLGFLLEPASRAYTASGSFVRFLLETRGSAVVRRLYRTGDYEAALGVPLAEAEAEWRAFLDALPLPPEAEGLARLRFERGSIFRQVCPHAVAALEAELSGALASGDDEAALARCDAILSIDPGHASVLAWQAATLARAGHVSEARRALEGLEARATTPIVMHARGALAEALWEAGDTAGAAALYAENAALPSTDDARRQLEIQRLALAEGGATEAALRELFASSPARTHDGAVTVSAIARLREARHDGLADYLEARQLAARERFDLAAPLLERARDAGLPTALVRLEARRVLAISLASTRRRDAARALFAEVLADPEAREGARVEARDWLARLAP